MIKEDGLQNVVAVMADGLAGGPGSPGKQHTPPTE